MPAKIALIFSLGVIESQICPFIKGFLRVAVVRKHGSADTTPDLQVSALEGYSSCDTLNDSFAYGFNSSSVLSGNQQDAKFISTQTRCAIGLSHRRPQPNCSFDQDDIPSIMAEDVVDLFEVVKINQHQSEGLASAAR